MGITYMTQLPRTKKTLQRQGGYLPSPHSCRSHAFRDKGSGVWRQINKRRTQISSSFTRKYCSIYTQKEKGGRKKYKVLHEVRTRHSSLTELFVERPWAFCRDAEAVVVGRSVEEGLGPAARVACLGSPALALPGSLPGPLSRPWTRLASAQG